MLNIEAAMMVIPIQYKMGVWARIYCYRDDFSIMMVELKDDSIITNSQYFVSVYLDDWTTIYLNKKFVLDYYLEDYVLYVNYNNGINQTYITMSNAKYTNVLEWSTQGDINVNADM